MVLPESSPQVLSIQSHVVSGYVGNKSAVFPLNVLGFEVHSINSVEFSNHTGYGMWKGQVLNAEELAELMSGLQINDLDNFSHLLTGYVGSASFLEQVYETVRQLKEKNPKLVYVCDPVMGDNGEMYVPQELLEIYRDKLIPLADIITPNQFEVELLTGKTITNENDAIECMEILHKMGVKVVVISSSLLGPSGCLTAFGSSKRSDSMEVWKLDIPRIPHLFTGTGDLFSALLLAWLHISNGDLSIAMANSLGSLQEVLRRTSAYADAQVKLGKTYGAKLLELQLIQSKKDIENPPQTFQAIRLS
ncbi:pyridoxal kinase-like isoform X2 [Daphnia carinata]|uniref:pyridoxal kinase-like isoform X2 n=1 Tax=Daphnia carinata TaxID=120202 RepID=UPI00257E4A27|nr:pyridoxal kinase-like isoform X2 [Daphnia carinata]